jgi:hypothetical protein
MVKASPHILGLLMEWKKALVEIEALSEQEAKGGIDGDSGQSSLPSLGAGKAGEEQHQRGEGRDKSALPRRWIRRDRSPQVQTKCLQQRDTREVLMAANGKEEFKSIMSDSDWQSVVNLLSVVEMVARYGPRYAEIASYALMDLDEIKKKIADELANIAKAKAEAEAKAQAEAVAKAREAARTEAEARGAQTIARQ